MKTAPFVPIAMPVPNPITVFVAFVMQPSVHNHKPLEPLGHHDRLRQTNRPTPILANERDPL